MWTVFRTHLNIESLDATNFALRGGITGLWSFLFERGTLSMEVQSAELEQGWNCQTRQ